MNNNPLRLIAATIIGLTLACAPALASAQSVTASTSINDLQSQIQSLLAQLAGLKQELQGVMMQSSSTMPWMNGSSTPPYMPWNNPGMGSSTPPMHGGMGCPTIDQTLSVGSSGSEVSQLQQFLSNLPGDLFPSGDVTGFFGPLTQQAVGMFQNQMDIASSSTGVVGPLTRAFFTRGCPMGGGMSNDGGTMASSSMNMHPMIPWMGTTTSTVSPAHPIQPPMHPMMGSTTVMWGQGTSTQPYWMTYAPPGQNPQQQQGIGQGGPGWHGSPVPQGNH